MALPLEVNNPTRLYTTAEFMALPLEAGYRYELVRGEIRAMSQPGKIHTLVCAILMAALNHFLYGKRLGLLCPPGGFELTLPGEDKDTVRSPDLTVLAQHKLGSAPGAIKEFPDLAVEVYSPNDRPGELRETLEDYQQAGWNIVWVIYPPDATPSRRASTVAIYQLQEESCLEPAQTLDQTEILSGEGILEGFSMPVSELFNLNLEQ